MLIDFISVKKNILIIILCFILVTIISCSDNVSLNSPDGLIVILKADDLGDTTANWNRFMRMVDDNKICASIGVIPAKISNEGSKAEIRKISFLKQVNNFAVIEFWNHGYNHSKNKLVTEFSGTDELSQINHIQLSQTFLYEVSQKTCHTFGAPFNHTSGVTSSALSNFPEINVWFSYQKNEKHFLNEWKDPDLKVINSIDQHLILNVDYLFLHGLPIGEAISNYDNDKKKPYIVIQFHPAKWSNLEFYKFEKLVHFYKENKRATFMTPYQYFRYLHKVYNADKI